MDAEKLKDVLSEHKKWLSGEGGKRADLAEDNLAGAYLTGADLAWADLTRATLTRATLREADLTWATLRGVNLEGAKLRGTTLTGADLTEAKLTLADLSGSIGLLDPTKYMLKNFEQDELGWIVYKVFDAFYTAPGNWKINAGEIIEEVVNPDRGTPCGSGINFGTLSWIKENIDYWEMKSIWRCRIRWIDACGIVVPFNADGKCRCSKLELIEIVKID